MRVFELFIQNEKLTASDWQRFVETITEYDKKPALEVVFDINTVEFYLHTHKDLSLLATKLEGFLLKPTDRQLTTNGDVLYKKLQFKLPSHKNVVEYREMEEIKKDRQIQKVIIQFYEILFVKIYKVKVYLKDKKGSVYYSSYLTLTNPLHTFGFDFKKNTKLK